MRVFASGLLIGMTTMACSNGSSASLTGPSAVVSAAVTPDDNARVKVYSVQGTVSSLAKPYHVVPGARIEIVGGTSSGLSAISTDQGTYQFPEVGAGFVTLRVTHPGYEAWSSKEFFLGANTTADPKLMPLVR